MTFNDWVKIVATAGIAGAIGAVISALIAQAFTVWLARRNRVLSEKKDAYLKFLDAYDDLISFEVDKELGLSETKSDLFSAYKRLSYAVGRVMLVGSPLSIKYARLIVDAPSKARGEHYTDLIRAMRADLRIDIASLPEMDPSKIKG